MTSGEADAARGAIKAEAISKTVLLAMASVSPTVSGRVYIYIYIAPSQYMLHGISFNKNEEFCKATGGPV